MNATLRPTLADRRLWQKRRMHYFAVLKRALMLLRERTSLPEDEPNLNRELQFAVVTARRELDPQGRFGFPIFDAQNPPDPDADTVQSYEFKKPDAQWRHDDPSAPDDRHYEKSFVVECKRLGFPTQAGWKLNEEYVAKGIQRFRSLEHRYGMHMAEGAMIGYVQSMGLSATHAEICRLAVAAGMPPLLPATSGWQSRRVTELAHQFERPFPISPFQLTHLWLDIQDLPMRARIAPPRKASKKAKPRRVKRTRSSPKAS